MGKEHFVPQDYNGLWHNDVELTEDTDSAVQDHGCEGGCPLHYRVLEVSGLDSGDSLNWILKQSTLSGSGYTEVARIPIAANGVYAFLLDNAIVENRYSKTTKDVTVASGNAFTIREYNFVRLPQG